MCNLYMRSLNKKKLLANISSHIAKNTSEMRNDISANKLAIQNINEQLNIKTGQITELQQDYNSQNSKINTLDGQIDTLNNSTNDSINKLNNEMAVVITRLNNLDNAIVNINNDIDNINNEISSLGGLI